MQKKFDPNLSIFLSDIHVSGKEVAGQPVYQNPLFVNAVDQILAMDPLPARVVIFGDISLWKGLSADYEESMDELNRIRDAGIDLILTLGNHDHRDSFFRYHPESLERSPVPGRAAATVDLGTLDLFLLDSLKEIGDEGGWNAVEGILDEAQAEWLCKAAAESKRPFIIGSHHPPCELRINGKDIRATFEDNPNFVGYVYGHKHQWIKNWYYSGFSKRHVTREVCIPSTGWWGTIGFAIMRSYEDRAVVSLKQSDFFFPSPLKEGEERPREWDEIFRENEGDSCTFSYRN